MRVCVCGCVCVGVCWLAHLSVTNKFSKINKDNNPFKCAAIELFTAIAHWLPFATVCFGFWIRAALDSKLCHAGPRMALVISGS